MQSTHILGRPDIPVGSPKQNAPVGQSKYTRQVAALLPHRVDSPEKAADAVQLYRTVLKEQPDHSVVVVTVGELTNIAALLKMPAADSFPSGPDLVKQKVREWVCMGGNFIGHPAKDDMKLGNTNFMCDKESALYAVQNWPGKLTFVGREIGSVPSGLRVGARMSELPESNPVRVGYQCYFDGKAKDRHVADQTTVLYAVRGLRDYWDIESKGLMNLHPDMKFEWQYEQDKHSYLLKKKIDGNSNDRTLEKIIEELMMHLPQARK